MKICEYVKVGEKEEQYEVVIPAEFDESGEVICEEHTEIRTRLVPIMGSVTRDMTPEEEQAYNDSLIKEEITANEQIGAENAFQVFFEGLANPDTNSISKIRGLAKEFIENTNKEI